PQTHRAVSLLNGPYRPAPQSKIDYPDRQIRHIAPTARSPRARSSALLHTSRSRSVSSARNTRAAQHAGVAPHADSAQHTPRCMQRLRSPGASQHAAHDGPPPAPSRWFPQHHAPSTRSRQAPRAPPFPLPHITTRPDPRLLEGVTATSCPSLDSPPPRRRPRSPTTKCRLSPTPPGQFMRSTHRTTESHAYDAWLNTGRRGAPPSPPSRLRPALDAVRSSRGAR